MNYLFKTILGLLILFNKQLQAQCKLDYSNYDLILNEQFDTYSGQVLNLIAPNTIWSAMPNQTGTGWGIELYSPDKLELIQDGSGGHLLRLKCEKLENPLLIGNKTYY